MAEVFKSFFMIKQRCFLKNSKNIFNDMHIVLSALKMHVIRCRGTTASVTPRGACVSACIFDTSRFSITEKAKILYIA